MEGKEKKNNDVGEYESSGPDTIKKAFIHLLNPITFSALIILTSVIALIAINLLGLDQRDILKNLSKPEYARGLITYIFAVGTIGVTLLITLAALLGKDPMEKKFQRAKEILTILIGIFGTIIGFYFGTEVIQGKKMDLQLAKPSVVEAVESGDTFSFLTHVSGGEAAYSYSISFDSEEIFADKQSTDGWIKVEIPAGDVQEDTKKIIKLKVKDAKERTIELEKEILVKKKLNKAQNFY